MWKGLQEGVLTLFFPLNCLNCRRSVDEQDPTRLLCSACLHSVEANIPPFCRRCSRHLLPGDTDKLCSICSANNLYFDHAWAACDYNATMQRLLHLFKYGQKTSLRRLLSRLIFSFLESYGLDERIKGCDALLPIPLHPTRERERGYNQSHLLAKEIADRYTLPLCTGNLTRRRHTPNQARQHKKQRWTNIRDAFTIRQPYTIHGKKVILIDDLLTTGATVSEAARVLKEAGARQVDVLTPAIAHEKH